MRSLRLALAIAGALHGLPPTAAAAAQASFAAGAAPELRSVPAASVMELAGRKLAEFPHFQHVRAFNAGSPVDVAVDTNSVERFVGSKAHVYVVRHKSAAEWAADPTLIDELGGPLSVNLQGGGVAANTFRLDPGLLSGHTGTTEIGVGYDVVVDANRSGRLDGEDAIDGGGDEAGFYVVGDLAAPGPYATVEVLYNGGRMRNQDVYYPANIDQLGKLPLLVVSHGNGHNYRWYDHIGHHMASWGYVVMSHFNNTGPGPNAAATTTLDNTNAFLQNLDLIGGGALFGHVDARRIVWIGHSRGGEGVARAYRRLVVGTELATEYGPTDIKLISSIAPTDFLGPGQSNPLGATYHLWTGGADSDVNGCADCNICQTFHLHERARKARMSISIHGVGHGDFHDGGGNAFAQGPCRVGRANTHRIMRGHLLALVKHVVDGEPPAQDYLWRQWEELRPIGAPTGPCAIVQLMYRESPDAGTLVIDDFQTNPELELSSSGGAVVLDVLNPLEGRLDDGNRNFNNVAADQMNGMTLAGPNDTSKGLVFEWTGDRARYLMFEVPAGARDVSDFAYLSFRAAQTTRHPLTTAEAGDVTFSVQLVDAAGRSGTISIGAYGGGIEEPYQRTGCGNNGAGWANEFETVRIALRDFRAGAGGPDLEDVVAVVFLFGADHGSAFGRIGFDELTFSRN